MMKTKSLRKSSPIRKTESIKQTEKNSSLFQPPPPLKTESIKQQPVQNSLFSAMKEGFSFGIGSSMGRMIVNQIFNDKKEINYSHNNDKDISENKVLPDNKVEIINNTDFFFKKYNECIEDNKKGYDIKECLEILEKK
jgi:hypothetical protein